MILNRMGQSYISYADFAIAMVDEIEQAKHIRERVTAVSCDPFFRNAVGHLLLCLFVEKS